jgi:hypothetical protein
MFGQYQDYSDTGNWYKIAETKFGYFCKDFFPYLSYHAKINAVSSNNDIVILLYGSAPLHYTFGQC